MYIHPESEEIKTFIKELQLEGLPLEEIVKKIFQWFDENIAYSRLSAPYSPLQRSDLDVLTMKSGTCGDYSNLLVAVLTSLGFRAQYAYLKKDCYGNPQDHICVAVWEDDRWKLVDATLPYRKWHGFDCPHQEYELLTPQVFEEKMWREELFWSERADSWGNERYAGLLYAPWIHEEIVVNTEERLETVFFLLIFDAEKQWQIYINYMVYTSELSKTPIMCRYCEDKECYCFSAKEAKHLWDDAQWSGEYLSEEVPEEFKTERLQKMSEVIRKVGPMIERIAREIN